MSPNPYALSVIIATHNRRERLRGCLEALASQTQDPAGFEVIVADDGSDDGSAAMAEALETRFRLRVLRRAREGKAVALNAAIELAEGEACLFLDDDVIASPELVARHAAAHAGKSRVLGIGPLEQPPPGKPNWFGSAYAEAWNERYVTLARRQPDWPDCYGGNFSANRAALIEIGGFDVGLPAVEDIELGFRLCAVGCEPRYLPGAHGIHDDQKSRRRILAAGEGYGAFCAEFAEREPAARSKLLGWFLDTTQREVLLRRAFLMLRIPPVAIAPLGALIPGKGRRQVWFGFVSRYAFWRGVRAATGRKRWLQTTRGVPVLMYHAFSAGLEPTRFVMPRRTFSRQMRLLAALRYRVIGFEELASSIRDGTPLPRRATVITIDDGYRDNLEIAQPILSRHGFSATVFLVSGRLAGENDWDEESELSGRSLLTPEQVGELRAAGTEVGAHTRSHPALPEIADEALVAELRGSRSDLEALLGEPVRTFAYPYGRFDERVVAATEEAGLTAACTVAGRRAGLGDGALTISRSEIRGTDSLAAFLRKLWWGGN
jgi:glycosyltransferase involved in cell wall biosynthesis/peptidoglycan/xylan/chitin deacetylase (PgdA/CDA1 family)